MTVSLRLKGSARKGKTLKLLGFAPNKKQTQIKAQKYK